MVEPAGLTRLDHFCSKSIANRYHSVTWIKIKHGIPFAPSMPLNGSKRGIFPFPVGQNGAWFCMSKERSDSMETTRSHSQLLIGEIYTVSLKKQRVFSLFSDFSFRAQIRTTVWFGARSFRIRRCQLHISSTKEGSAPGKWEATVNRQCMALII